MALTLSKSSLKHEQDQLKLFRRYLPSLDLKRQQLVALSKASRQELMALEAAMKDLLSSLEDFLPLLGSDAGDIEKLSGVVRIRAVRVEEENVLGVRMPVARQVEYETAPYSMLITPLWIDFLVDCLQRMATLRVKLGVQRARVERVDAAVRRITQRVNLFDKVLIPDAKKNIQKITVFLADQERAAVVRSKISKLKQKG